MSAGVVVRDRELAIKLLAGSAEDFGSWLFDVRGSGRRSTSGLGPAKKIACPDCTRRPKPNVEPKPGLLIDRFGRESPCPSCTKVGKKRGTGRVDADSTLEGDVPVQSVDTTAVATRAARKRTCLDCEGDGALPNGRRCRTCKGEGRIVVDGFVLADDRGEEQDPLDAYEKAIERRDASGDYRPYLILEAELRARSPHLLTPFRALYVEVPKVKKLPAGEARKAGQALEFFARFMPTEIRVPGWVVKADEAARAQRTPRSNGIRPKDLAVRDAEIIERFRSGEKAKEIAADTGLSVPRVNEIVYAERVA